MSRVIGIVGGKQKNFQRIERRFDVKIRYHDGHGNDVRTKRELKELIRSSDVVVMIISEISHASMYLVRDESKKWGKEVIYHKGKGVHEVIQDIS